MTSSTKILNFARQFKQFIDTHNKDGKTPHVFEYDLVRETQLNNLEESKKGKE